MKDKIADQGIIKEKCSGPMTRFPDMGKVSHESLKDGVETKAMSSVDLGMKHPLKKS